MLSVRHKASDLHFPNISLAIRSYSLGYSVSDLRWDAILNHINQTIMNNKIYKSALSLLLFFGIFSVAGAQTFTRVTSLSNPVVTDTDRSGGLSWIDIDNDNDLDLFVSNGNLTSQNNRLYINNGGGTFTKVIAGSIVTDGGASIGSTWGDYDNDGFLDCFVTNRNFFGNFLYRGNGTANPVKQAGIGPVTDIANSNMSSWVDVDNDGDLDLYCVNFQGSDYLYLNSGAGAYSFSGNQSNAIQLDSANFSIAGLWADYNNDRRPDLFVGNSGSQNDKLYTNTGGLNFTSFTFADARASLGGSWADYDNDGDLDLFITNYLAQACILYNNSGAPAYTLTPVTSSPAQVVGNNVGSAFGDLDNDGDLDLFVADDGGNEHLYINSGFPAYAFTADTSGQITHDGGNSFACLLGDYDNDGSLDVAVANLRSQTNFLYHNDGNANRWITIKCVGMQSNKAAIGAKVLAKATIGGQGIWQMQEVPAQTGYNAQNLWLHFGFGSATLIDTLIINWPSGKTDTCIHLPTSTFYTAVEGVSCVLPTVSVPSIARGAALAISIIPNPAHDLIRIEIVNPAAENIRDITITNALGARIATLPVNNSASMINFTGSASRLGLSAGTYFAAVRGGQSLRVLKFVVE